MQITLLIYTKYLDLISTMKKSIVDHAYEDYSQDLVVNFQETNKKLFPAKLHIIISSPEYQHIIAWKPHGRAWSLLNKSLFISEVLPRHFNHSNFGSFNRSVNGWGFKVCASLISPLHHSPLNFAQTWHYGGSIDTILHTAPCEGGARSERILSPSLSPWQVWVNKYNDSLD